MKNKHPQDDTPLDEPEVPPDTTPQTQEKSIVEERNEYLAGWQRATADYRNLQQTLAREREHTSKYATRAVLTDILEVADALYDALRVAPTPDIEQLNKKLHQILERHGVRIVPVAAGDAFDPTIHESLGGEGDHIAHIAQQGYQLHETLIRPARVILK